MEPAAIAAAQIAADPANFVNLMWRPPFHAFGFHAFGFMLLPYLANAEVRTWIASCEREDSERARIKAAPHRRLDDDQFPKTFVGRYHA
jgi:hypothetical protein